MLAVTLALLAALGMLFWGQALRWLCAATLLAAAAAGYFSTVLGIHIDKTMVPNAAVAPANLLAASIQHFATTHAANVVRALRGTDAHAAYAIPKPRLLLLVLGETTRARSVGLNGYARDTTPPMRAAGGFYFPDTESCGTATAISVPCLFSGFGRRDFTLLKGLENETLIDVVLRAGARVLWIDNDSGCKGVCDHAEVHDLTGSPAGRWCPEAGECHDEILLEGLEERLAGPARDTLVVLHLKGSHGPAYFKRYPAAFERFVPA